MRDVYLTDDPVEAAMLLDKTIAGCLTDQVAEIRSLGNTLKRWRTEILAHHDTGASNGPSEGLIIWSGRGFENFSATGSVCYSAPANRPGRTDPHHPSSAQNQPSHAHA